MFLRFAKLISNNLRLFSTMTNDKFKGKVAIITASTDGIGLAIARKLGQDGASVIISSRKAENVTRTTSDLVKNGIDAIGTVCHVGKEEDRKNLIDFAIEKKGRIDMFISNAAVNTRICNFLDTDEKSFDKILDTNIKSPFLLTKLVVPYLEKQGGGSIVYISSIVGYQTLNMLACYSISKTALLALSRAVALDVVSSNIRVNCVCPGIIKTNFSSAITNSELGEYLKGITPMKRFGEPKEIASLVAFLCSNDASFITGESFVASGGLFSRL